VRRVEGSVLGLISQLVLGASGGMGASLICAVRFAEAKAAEAKQRRALAVDEREMIEME
jgi:hypothetical protein